MTTLMSDRKLKEVRGHSMSRAPLASRAGAWLAAVLAAQRDRWILWLGPAVIAGAAIWLLSPRDPPIWAAPAIVAASSGLAILFAAWPSSRPEGWGARLRAMVAGLALVVAAASAGAVAAQIRAALAVAPRLAAPLDGVRLEGWVIERLGGERPRLLIRVRSLEGIAAPPLYVRVSTGRQTALGAGRAINCRVSLRAPDGPLAPGAYDFARRAFFERLGGVGYAQGPCRPAPLPPPADVLFRAQLFVGAVRADLSAIIQEAAPGRGGAIAAALIAGDEGAVDPDTNSTLRDSGIGHLLSVSGLHMGVVGGLVFAALLWIAAIVPPLALRVPAKKIAAAGALATLAFYLVISGSSVPAIRSFIMAAVAFIAVLIDRPALTMRGLALAAILVTLVFPESVLEAGFQMSFAATAALVAALEVQRGRAPHALPSPGPFIGGLQNLGRLGAGALATSFIAGLATDPFALFHFQRFALYGLAANLAIAPIVSFIVAPAAAIAAIAAPFGLADGPLAVLAWSLDLVAKVGDAFGARPEAVLTLPRPPDLFLPLAVMGIAWACLWRGVLRLGGLVWVAAALAIYIAAPNPVLAFDTDLRAVFARDGDAWRLMSAGGRSTFARDRLGQQLGLAPAALEALAPPECDDALCTWRTPLRRRVFFVRAPEGFARACERSAVLLARLDAPQDVAVRCGVTAMDGRALRAQGGAILYENPRGFRIDRAAPASVSRPWTPVQE